MTKKTASTKAERELGYEEAQSPSPIKVYVGHFSPPFGFTFEQLCALIASAGILTTPPFTGQDQNGNLIDQTGRVIIPQHFARFFEARELEVTQG